MQGKNEKKAVFSALSSAPGAVALDLKGMGHAVELVLHAQFVLDLLKFRVEDFYHRPTFKAYEMVVMTMAESMLIVGVLVVLFDLLYESAVDKQR